MARTNLVRGTFPRLYQPYRGHIPSALIICTILVGLVVILSKHVLKAAYRIEGSSSSTSSSNRSRTSDKDKEKARRKEKDDKDAAKMTPWVMNEIKHRQAEKDEPGKTLQRVAKDAEKEKLKLKGVQEKVDKKEFDEYRADRAKERNGEIEVLRKQLVKLGLPLVGIPEKAEPDTDNAKEDGGGGKDDKGIVSDLGKLKNKVVGWFDKKYKDKEDAPKAEPVPIKEKLKEAFFLDAYSDKAVSNNQAKMEVEAYKAQVKAQTIAELEAREAEVEAARQINASAANAEALARKMRG